MGWDKGRYYTRSKKINGRVVREYLGIGDVAELMAQMDVIEREERRLAARLRKKEKTSLATIDADMKALAKVANTLARAGLLAAGFHQHKRGEWRLRREHTPKSE